MALRLGRDGLLVGDLGHLGVELDAHVLLEPFHHDPQVQLAETAHDGLLGRADAFDDQRWVLGGEFMDRAGELGLVGVVLELDRQAVHGLGQGQGLEMHRVQVVALVEHGIEVDLVNLADRADVARPQLINLVGLLALAFEQVTDLHGLLGIADDDLGLGLERALMDAEDAQLPDERVGRALEDMGQHRLGRVGLSSESHLIATGLITLEERPRVALQRVGQQRSDDMQELLDPRPALGAAEGDGHEVRLAERLLEHIVQLFFADVVLVAVLEVLVHQLVLHLDDLLDDRLMGVGLG